MIEVITDRNFDTFAGYLTDYQINQVTWLGMTYGEEVTGTCALIHRGLTLIVNAVHINPLFLEDTVEELLHYLLQYMWEHNLQILEIHLEDEHIKKMLLEYGIQFERDTVSYQCSMEELLKKKSIQEIYAYGKKVAKAAGVRTLVDADKKKLPKKASWVMDEADLDGSISHIVYKDNEVKGFCGVEVLTDLHGQEKVRLSYLYANGSKWLVAVLSASLEAIQTKIEPKAQFTFVAINEKSAALAKGIGFVDEEIRSESVVGRISYMEFMEWITLKESIL